ncbi:hypothetical protein ABNF97_17120 [Plantactinospora sp. B6F1]|uniref:hypothetical protein n=1 Tax=Plantactinospora sp. B6F1 TaxID=3158971 RepID=UPI0032D8B7E4
MTRPSSVPPGPGPDALAAPPPAPPHRDPLAPPPPSTGPPTVILRYAEVDTAVLPVVDPDPPPTAALAAIASAGPRQHSGGDETPMTATPAEPGGSGTGQLGWWRRNRWGLLALLPALVLALGPGMRDGYQRYSQAEYLEPVGVGADGWVGFSDARIRLVELVEAPSVPARGSRRVTLPAGVRVWRAVLVFEPSTPEALIGCLSYLEDRDGRLFSWNPAELRGAGLPIPRCVADDPAVRSFQTEAYFVLPDSAVPAAVWIVKATQRPRYARLPLG